MITVTTQHELEQAILNREPKILCKGEAAQPFLKRRKRKRAATIGGAALAVLGAIAIPFTGGVSTGLIAMGLTIGTVTITTAELAIICGTVIVAMGILKGGKVTFKTASDGSIEVVFEPQYKE